MMAFDEAKFREAAKAAGYSDKEIDAELKGPAPAGAAPAPSMDDTFADKERALREEYEKKIKQATTSEVSIGDRTFEIPTFFTSPAGIVTAAGAGIGLASTLIGAGAIAPKIYQSIKNRYMTQTPEIDRTRDIPMGGTFDNPPVVEQAPVPQASPDRLQQSQQIAEETRRLGIGPKPVPPTAPVAAPVEPPGPVATPFSAAPPGAAAPEASAQPNSPTTSIVNNTVKEMIDEVDKPPQGIYRDAAGNLVYPEQMSPGARAGAEAFAQQYPEQAAALEAEKRFAILGAGAADNNLFNAYGADLRKQILNEVNQGQPAGVYSNYTGKINPAIKAIPPDSALGKQLEDLRANQPKSATRGSLGVSAAATPTGLVQGSKIADALKNAGKVALVMSMADAANAATKGDYTGAAKIAGPALDPTGILEAAVNPQSTARNITNVSPVFGFLSQLIASQADQRAKKAYVEKVNRAVPPPMR
jgi:hypothetical protein